MLAGNYEFLTSRAICRFCSHFVAPLVFYRPTHIKVVTQIVMDKQWLNRSNCTTHKTYYRLSGLQTSLMDLPSQKKMHYRIIQNCTEAPIGLFELLYFNQFSSFIVQLRSVNCFLQNEWINGNFFLLSLSPTYPPNPRRLSEHLAVVLPGTSWHCRCCDVLTTSIRFARNLKA